MRLSDALTVSPEARFPFSGPERHQAEPIPRPGSAIDAEAITTIMQRLSQASARILICRLGAAHATAADLPAL